MQESDVQNSVRLAASREGWRLWRNNSGAFKDERGRVVRYGLANDSPKVNACIKSSDLIGWRRLTITPDMVGQTVAVFVARECKRSDWKFSGSPRELAQAKFIDMLNADGGDGAFTTGGLK